MWSIYSINHPDDGRPFYIGMSTKPECRFRYHKSFSHNRGVRRLMARLKKAGKSPELRILRSGITDKEEAAMAEREEIVRSKKLNRRLLNRHNRLLPWQILPSLNQEQP